MNAPTTADADLVVIHTDGACSGNPGPGGWAAILSWRGRSRELSGASAATTNNIMELTAAIMALEALKRPSRVRLHTDSRYVMDGITRWIHGWKKNGWKTSAREPVKNAGLWQRLDAACDRALAINTRTMTSVKSILLNRLDGRRPVQPPEAPPITHANIRGPKFFH